MAYQKVNAHLLLSKLLVSIKYAPNWGIFNVIHEAVAGELTNGTFMCYNSSYMTSTKNYILTVFIAIALLVQAPHAHAATMGYEYDLQYGNPMYGENCATSADARWRTDEPYADQYGTYSDPYAYGPFMSSAQGDVGTQYEFDQYSYTARQGGYGKTNLGTYPGIAPAYDGSYTQGYVTQGDVDSIALQNLRAATAGQQVAGVRYVERVPSQGQVLGASTVNTSNGARPSCHIKPKSAGSNQVVLEWTTAAATTAFIDNGIGHVVLGSGTRLVTPTTTTTYNMTVVDSRGFSSQCAAVVNIAGTPITTSTTVNAPVVAGASTTNGGATTTVGTVPVAGVAPSTDPLTQVTSGAVKIGGNVTDKVTNTLETGKSLWERIRQMSMFAIGIILVLFILVFIMRKVFGGGEEAHH